MAFPAIEGPDGPDEFSWEVALAPGQELESIDDQRAEIYYTDGLRPGLEIFAEPAHDADGLTVPTSLGVSGGNVVTLFVHHRAGSPDKGGAPFHYPIMAGEGWEGGYQTVVVSGPPAERDLQAYEGAQSAMTGEARKHKRGDIGGPPSTRLTPPDQGKQTTPALVIGRGRLLGASVEIAGAGWSAPSFFETPGGGQLCVWIEYLAEQAISSVCGPVAQTASGKEAVYIESLGGGMGGDGSRETEIAGSLAPDVASIRVSFGRQGRPRLFHAAAVVAHVRGELQKRLKQPASFGYFAIKVRGRFIERSLRMRAFDREGRLVGVSRGVSSEFLP